MDQATANWRQSGTVFLWRYVDDSPNFGGRHLTGDDDGCASLLQLISLMQSAEFTAKAVVELSAAGTSQLQVTNHRGRTKSYRRWEIVHSKQKHDADHWRLTEHGDVLGLEIGVERLGELRKGIEDIQSGNGDYRIGVEGEELWFWWTVRT